MPCATDLAAPEVLLAWTNLPNDDAAIASTTRIELGANNLLDVPVSLENVSAVGDAGGLPILSTLGDFVVEPSGSKIWSLDLGELGINPASMVFAGVLVVEAKIVVQDRGSIGRTSSPPIYFHPLTDGSFAVYGERAMRETFAAGDFTSALDSVVATDASPRTRRIIQGGFVITGIGAE